MMPSITDRDRRWTLFGTLALAAVLTAAVATALTCGDGSPSWQRAVALTASVCGVGSLAGWLLARRRKPTAAMAVAGGLAAVVLRIFLPLATLGWLQTAGGELRDIGAERLLVAFYLALLATDVVLHIIGAVRSGRCGGRTSMN